ncbi:hypothetical protein Poli38472_002071 [Pythium oligandrum]|uniref:Uncharacterized protein n=1 Tax=Pythium oligandrum TaxID=41045 RepID=A0A8K1CH50_PYTOL|nr:hypothetical protein Poli38472_002071 [Pythium oligandrum]|eukprot:TMW63130.1 hypothetical protein Poli38472_002071 [Pythium oligandrum]
MSTKRKLSELETSDPADLEPDHSSPASDEVVAESSDDPEELSTGITGHEAYRDAPASPQTQEALEDEIETLEAVIQRLDQEKHALKMRLNEIQYHQKFNVNDCKKWLAANFDFDRKDTPELLAGIFENYLMQNDTLEPLPHQLMVKNSNRAQARREKLVHKRSQYRKEKDNKKQVEAQTARAKKVSTKGQDGSSSDPGAYGQFLYLHPQEIEQFYAEKPWMVLDNRFPKIRPTAKQSDISELVEQQERFLKENLWAIWERYHWFPIKHENGKSPEEIKQLGTHHNRRKRRQAQLKERIELLNTELKSSVDKSVLEQSVFGDRWVEIIMKRPKLWLPREDESLLAQLEELDALEPDRNFNFFS